MRFKHDLNRSSETEDEKIRREQSRAQVTIVIVIMAAIIASILIMFTTSPELMQWLESVMEG